MIVIRFIPSTQYTLKQAVTAGTNKQAGWFVLNSLLQSSLVPSAESVLTIHTLAMPQ